MNSPVVVKKGSKRLIVAYFFRILADMSSKREHKKYCKDQSKALKGEVWDDETKIYTGVIKRL